jgi:hypothetical protein
VMHCLTGTYISEVGAGDSELISNPSKLVSDDDKSGGPETYVPMKLVIPPNKSRIIYFRKESDRSEWTKRFEAAMERTNIFDFYTMDQTLGKGQFGLVKLGKHKKTG